MEGEEEREKEGGTGALRDGLRSAARRVSSKVDMEEVVVEGMGLERRDFESLDPEELAFREEVFLERGT